MNKAYAKISPVPIIISLILLLSACTGPKAQTAQLPDGLSTAMVPAVPLDAYLYVRQSQPTVVSRAGGGGLVAKSSYPGVVISTTLGRAASRLNIEKTEVDGKAAYYRAVDAPTGDKVHVFFNNLGQYIYAQGAADLSRGQQLFRWVWGSNRCFDFPEKGVIYSPVMGLPSFSTGKLFCGELKTCSVGLASG